MVLTPGPTSLKTIASWMGRCYYQSVSHVIQHATQMRITAIGKWNKAGECDKKNASAREVALLQSAESGGRTSMKRPNPMLPLCWAALVALSAGFAAGATPSDLPNGTPVTLRFAVGLYTKQLAEHGPVTKKGDVVRLVAASDVRMGNKVVIARGANAQATVTRAIPANDPYSRDCLWRGPYDPCHSGKRTGLTLRLEWVQAVEGTRIPIRAAAGGKNKDFSVEVIAKGPGFVASPANGFWGVMRSLRTWDGTGISRALHEMKLRLGVPVGTRITCYVDGDAALSAEALDSAQAHFPSVDEPAVLTIYRAKGGSHEVASLFNEDRKLLELNEREYVAFDIPSGKYAFNLAQQVPEQFDFRGGQDYYLLVRHKALTSGWELKLMDAAEAEDDLATTEAKPNAGDLAALLRRHE
jgi:hypothetical protein